MKNSVIRRVQELCKERNMSLYKLAKLSNIPNTTLTNMVAQNKMPTIPTIERICHGFDITLAQFFSSKELYPDVTEEERVLLELWDSLTDREKELAKVYMKGLSDAHSR